MGLLESATQRRSAHHEQSTVAPDLRTVFVLETQEHMDDWEEALLALEQDPSDETLIDRIFRAVHTLKGSAGFIGLPALQAMAHRLESILQQARERHVRLAPDGIEAAFSSLDVCRRMVACFDAGEEFTENIDAVIDERRRLLEEPTTTGSGDSPFTEVPPPRTDAAYLPNAHGGQPNTDSPSRKTMTVTLMISAFGREAYLRAFLVRNRISPVAAILHEEPEPELLRDAKSASRYSLTITTAHDENRLREALNVDQVEILSIEEAATPSTSGSAGPVKQTPARDKAESTPRSDEVVRVSVDRLDNLLNIVGELAIQTTGFLTIGEEMKSRLGQERIVSSLNENTERLARITRELQDGVMKVRMLPISNVFNRFHRVVRDLARKRGKEVSLEIFGGETEIDKKVIDRIGDPLVHLIRNAVDHGIETKKDRTTSGKAPIGRVRLGAYQEGDHICIQVSDDGRGLDRDAVLQQAVKKHLIRREEATRISEETVLQMIFLPGFSTATQITEISGRGVGMDAVKSAIEDLGGSIRLRSVFGGGTSVTIFLPLTTAIIPALLADAGGAAVAVPLSAVREVLSTRGAQLGTVGNCRVVQLRGQVVVMVALGAAISLYREEHPAGDDCPRSVIIVEHENKRLGLAVDRILGTREIVIKSLSRHYREVAGLIGASILGNGKIALIVDVESIVRTYFKAAGTSSTQLISEPREIASAPQGPAGDRDEQTDDQRMTAPTPPTEPERSVEALSTALNRSRIEAFDEINSTGALQASASLSQILGDEVRVSFPESTFCPIGEIATRLGGAERKIGGAYIGIEGDLIGGILVALPENAIELLLASLYRSADAASGALDLHDLSGLSEFTNILSASFINAIADAAGFSLQSQSPEITFDACQAIIDSVVSRFVQPGDRILVTSAVLSIGANEQVTGNIIVFLDAESILRLANILGPEEG